MSEVDEIREYCMVHYVTPAKERGDYTVSIRTGDIHSELFYSNRLPLVCAALGATTFEHQNNLRRISVLGPLNGASTLFTYLILDHFRSES